MEILTGSILTYMVVTMITPGPNNLTMLFIGANYGFLGTRKFLIASTVTFFIKVMLCGFLNVVLESYIPVAIVYLKWFGVLYMLYLGYVMAISGWKQDKANVVKDDNNTDVIEKRDNQTNNNFGYMSAVILQTLNVKSWITCLSLYAVYVMDKTADTWTMFIVGVIYTAIMIVASSAWGLLGSSLKSFIDKHRKPFGIIMGLSMLYAIAGILK